MLARNLAYLLLVTSILSLDTRAEGECQAAELTPKSEDASASETWRIEQIDGDSWYVVESQKALDSLLASSELAIVAALKLCDGIHDTDLERLRGTGVVDLNLSGAGFTGAGLASLQGIEGLVRLTLSGSGFTDAGLESLKGIKGLKVLVLIRPGFTDAAIKKLRKEVGFKIYQY